MSDLTSLSLEDELAVCQQAAAEAAAALSRALDTTITPGTVEGQALQISHPPEELSGPGLAVVLSVGGAGLLVLLPESSGLVPAWCAAPDATGTSKLAAMAQELGVVLLPETLMAEQFAAGRVKHLAGVLGRAGVSDEARWLALGLSGSSAPGGRAWIVWPVAHPGAVLSPGGSPAEAVAAPTVFPLRESPASPPRAARAPLQRIRALQELPRYTQSLLRIRLPVLVTLAHHKQPLGRIVELGAGSIIHFEKSCEDMLELEVGGQTVARGEAIKVGDKFGLRITSIVLPDERFKSVPSRQR